MSLRIVFTTWLLSGLLSTGILFATEQRGSVKVGGLPIPGANVTATLGEQKIVTSTDDNGVFIFPNLGPGVWTIEVEISH